jgi:hypothetical protein
VGDGVPPPLTIPCTSESKDFFQGAFVHIPGHCQAGWTSELLRRDGGPEYGIWRALTDTGIVHGVSAETGHVVCGYGEEADWVMEKYEPLTMFTSAWFELPNEIRDLFDPERHHWVKIMNPRTFEVAMRWVKAKHDDGLLVRIRNVRTGDIVMGAIA